MQIGSVKADVGAKTHGFLEVAKSAAGFPISIPVIIVNGSQSGPTMVAIAAMHGTEVIGTAAISRFYRDVDPKKIKGAFIGVPILSMWAFEAEHRLPTLFDHQDIERMFPGNVEGSLTERLASTFLSQIASKGDCVLDFHGQDQYWQPTRAAIVPKLNGQVKKETYGRCIELARTFGVDQVWRINKPNNFTEVLIREKSIPAISLEFGGTADFNMTESYIELAIDGIKRIMKWLGMIEPQEHHGEETNPKIMDLHAILSKNGGIWSTRARVGNEVKKSDLLGTISDPITGQTIEEIRAPFDGVLGLVWCPPVIKPASAAIAIGKIIESY